MDNQEARQQPKKFKSRKVVITVEEDEENFAVHVNNKGKFNSLELAGLAEEFSRIAKRKGSVERQGPRNPFSMGLGINLAEMLGDGSKLRDEIRKRFESRMQEKQSQNNAGGERSQAGQSEADSIKTQS